MLTKEQRRELAGFLDTHGWTKGWYAAKANGDTCVWNHPKAVCWCMRGAVLSVVETDEQRDLAIGLIRNVIGESHIGLWNDDPERTIEEVRSAMHRAFDTP